VLQQFLCMSKNVSTVRFAVRLTGSMTTLSMKSGRQKSTQASIQAAGGIVMRPGRRPLFAIVQRRKDNGWVLPKGKLKPGENALAAARREAVEETGHPVTVHDYLGSVSYKAGRRPKVVGFWRMQLAEGAPREPAPDIKAVEWLGLNAAIARLTQPLERAFLAHVGARAIKGMRLEAAARAPRKLARKRLVASKRKMPSGKGQHADVTLVAVPVPRPNFLRRLFARFDGDARL
jgi:8-oxo-dGTP diphosphatase